MRVAFDQDILEHVRGDVIDDRHLQDPQGVEKDLPVSRRVANRNVIAETADGEPAVLLDEPVLKEDL